MGKGAQRLRTLMVSWSGREVLPLHYPRSGRRSGTADRPAAPDGVKLDAAVAWFLDRLDAPPTRIHTRAVWADEEGGSVLGSHAHTRAFQLWLEAGESSVVREEWEEACPHPLLTSADRQAGRLCETCGVRNEEGRVVAESGKRPRVRLRYRWPMRAALARLARVPARPGLPGLHTVLWQLAVAEGDVARVADLLASSHPLMGDLGAAVRHVSLALSRLRSAYREEAPPRHVAGERSTIERSESQAIAEAEGRRGR